MRVLLLPLFLLPVGLVFGLSLPGLSSLEGVLLVARHGTRAPNALVARLCPLNAPNFDRFGLLRISPEGVTGRGMREMGQMGEWTRERYVEGRFLWPFYDSRHLYVRAVGEDRTLQSASAWAAGLFPPSEDGPIGWPTSFSPPLPVYTLPDELDSLLENRKSGCRLRLREDVTLYDADRGRAEREKHRSMLHEIEQLCGANVTREAMGTGDNFGDAIKDITDSWTFDLMEHFEPLSGLTVDKLERYRSYALKMLLGRILGTPDQITYMNGDLPETMIETFAKLVKQASNESAPDPSAKAPLKFIAYHGHREMLYALAALLDIRFNISYPALPLGAIPAATALVFELHRHVALKSDSNTVPLHTYTVHALMWTPCDVALETTLSKTTKRDPHAAEPSSPFSAVHDDFPESWSVSRALVSECGARPIAINKCASGICTLDAFQRIVQNQVKSTGDWKSLCSEDKQSSEFAKNTSALSTSAHASAFNFRSFFAYTFVVAAITAAAYLYCCILSRRHDYRSV